MDVFPHLQPSRQRSSFRPNFQYYWQRGAHSESGAGGHVGVTREQQGSRDMYELHSRRNTTSPPPHIKSEIQVAGRPPRARRHATGQGTRQTGTRLMPCLTRSGHRAHGAADAGGAFARQWRKRLRRIRATQTWVGGCGCGVGCWRRSGAVVDGGRKTGGVRCFDGRQINWPKKSTIDMQLL